MSSNVFSRCSIVRRAANAVAVAFMPLFFGGWSWIEGPQSTFDTQGPVAKSQLDVFYVTVWVTLAIFVLVSIALAYATLKFKARKGSDPRATPVSQSHGNPLVELSLIAASVFSLVIIAVPTLRAIWYTYDVPAAEKANAYEVTATGYQWWFKFEYPHEKVDAGGTLVAANELVIPAGRPVRVHLRTSDVIHSFWVPKLAGKVDMIPNRGNLLWLQANEPGYFWGQCAEFCGEDHAVMRFRVIALAEKDFAEWLEQQKKPARVVEAGQPAAGQEQLRIQPAKLEFKRNEHGWTPEFDASPFENWKQKQFPEKEENPALIAQGRKLFTSKTCAGCHTVRGHEGGGIAGPDLTHVGARTTIAAGLLENNPTNLYRWLTDPHGVKPHNKMYVGVPLGGSVMPGYTVRNPETGELIKNFTVNHDEAIALVAYLHSLK